MKSYSIAVVDDSMDDCRAIQRHLARANQESYRVHCLNGFEAGRAAITDQQFDLYLIDLDIDGRSGLELIQTARDAQVSAPIVVVTGNDNPSIDIQALEMGATDFISKEEINSQSLARTIRHAFTRKAYELKLEHAANHDGLTELAHKSHFNSELARAIARHKRNDSLLAVALIDLNHFKPVNDHYGHLAGDSVLQTVARRLRQLVRRGDLVGRLGGDEFGILLEDVDSPAQLEELFSQIHEYIEKPIDYQGQNISISCSTGVAHFPEDGASPDSLMSMADSRMYNHKARTRHALN